MLVSGFAAFGIIGCNEGNSKSASKVELFPAGSIAVEIASNEKGVRKIVRMTDRSQKVLGYRVEMQVVSRSGPFNIMVALDSRACVLYAKVLTYRGRRGRKVRSKAFIRQFAGKCPSDAVRVGNDIDAVTGATLSSKAMTGGVRRAIEMVKALGKTNAPEVF